MKMYSQVKMRGRNMKKHNILNLHNVALAIDIIVIIAMFVITFNLPSRAKLVKSDSTLSQIEQSYLNEQKGTDITVRADSDSYTKTEKGKSKCFVIRDKNTNEILAKYIAVDKEGKSLRKISKVLILDKHQDSLTKPTYKEVSVENYYNINKTIKEYNSKYTDTVLSYENILVLPYDYIAYIILITVFIACIVLMGLTLR